MFSPGGDIQLLILLMENSRKAELFYGKKIFMSKVVILLTVFVQVNKNPNLNRFTVVLISHSALMEGMAKMQTDVPDKCCTPGFCHCGIADGIFRAF